MRALKTRVLGPLTLPGTPEETWQLLGELEGRRVESGGVMKVGLSKCMKKLTNLDLSLSPIGLDNHHSLSMIIWRISPKTLPFFSLSPLFNFPAFSNFFDRGENGRR